MRPVKFKYEKVGHVIMLEENVWKRIVKFMQKNGVQVEERPTPRAADLGWTCPVCDSWNLESDLDCGYCDTPRPSR